MKSRIDQARETPIVYVIENILGIKRISGRGDGVHAYFCPFHNDQRNPSLLAYPRANQCQCMAGCQIATNGREKAGPIDLVMRATGKSLKDAVELILNKQAAPVSPTKHTAVRKYAKVEWMLYYHRQLKNALPYLESRGITEETARRFRLGYSVTQPSGELTWPDGSTTPYPLRPSITIPYWTGTEVETIVGRLDTLRAHYLWARLPEPFKSKMHLLKGMTVQEQIEWLFGGRYRAYPRSTSDSFYLKPLFLDKDGAPKKLKEAFIVEGQIDALSLVQELNVTAGATKTSKEMKYLLSNTETVYWVADRDKNGQGEKIAQQAKAISEHPNFQIIYPLDGFKDVNEMLVAGKIKEWYHSVVPTTSKE